MIFVRRFTLLKVTYTQSIDTFSLTGKFVCTRDTEFQDLCSVSDMEDLGGKVFHFGMPRKSMISGS